MHLNLNRRREHLNVCKRIFATQKQIISMFPLKAKGYRGMMGRARQEITVYYNNGVDSVLVENYFGSAADCRKC